MQHGRLSGLGDANVLSTAGVSTAGGVDWASWLKAGTQIGQTVFSLTQGGAPSLGPQTLTPAVVPPLATVQPVSPIDWLKANWYIPAALVALAVLGGRKRR